MTFGQYWDELMKERNIKEMKELNFILYDVFEIDKLTELFKRYSAIDIANEKSFLIKETEEGLRIWINLAYWDLEAVLKTYLKQLETDKLLKWI